MYSAGVLMHLYSATCEAASPTAAPLACVNSAMRAAVTPALPWTAASMSLLTVATSPALAASRMAAPRAALLRARAAAFGQGGLLGGAELEGRHVFDGRQVSRHREQRRLVGEGGRLVEAGQWLEGHRERGGGGLCVRGFGVQRGAGWLASCGAHVARAAVGGRANARGARGVPVS